MLRVVVDTDPGTDDALALLLLLGRPGVEVVGVTTVGGNATLAHTTRNALSLLEAFGHPRVPVARGSARPLAGQFHYAYDFHGPGGLGLRLPRPAERPRPLRAPDFLGSVFYAFGGRCALLALGPLTNIAHALGRHTWLARAVPRAVVMGGAVYGPGNVTPFAEFNFYNDPLAAHRVLTSGIPITLVPLEACRQVPLREGDLERLRRARGPGRLMARMLARWFRDHRGQDYHPCDALAAAVLLQPDLAHTTRLGLRVVTQGERRGQTEPLGEQGDVEVVTDVDAPRFYSLLWQALGV